MDPNKINNIFVNKFLLLGLFIYAAIGAFFISVLNNAFAYPFVSEFSILLFMLPIFYTLFKIHGLGKTLKIILIFSVVGLFIEYIALKTGLPYGDFTYGQTAVFKLKDVLPWTVGVSWSIFVFGAMGLSCLIKTKNILLRAIFCGLILVLFDMILDPGAVSIKMWSYEQTGAWYGIPMQNFIGWFFTGTVAGLIGFSITDPNKKYLNLFYGFLPMMFFWSAICLFNKLLLPGAIGLTLVLFGVLKYISEKNT